MQKNAVVMVIGLFVFAKTAAAVELFVAPTGNDANQGSNTAPLATLEGAQQVIASRKLAGKEPVTVTVADGVYYLPDTLVFTPDDGGTKTHPVLYRSQTEGGAVLSGGTELQLSWEPHENGVFKAETPADLSIDQLFVDGQKQRMARYPNFDPAKKAEPYQGYAADAFSLARAANWSSPIGGYIHAMHRGSWGGYHYRITGMNADGEVTYEGGWQNNRRSAMHKNYRMVENIFEELDAPGEWYHSAQTKTLYYKPVQGLNLDAAKVAIVRLRHLVELRGSEALPVKYLTLQGFVFRHAARTFMQTNEPLLRSDWAIYRGGAFMLTGTENVSILDCEFDQLGGNAIFVSNYNRGVLIKGCHIHETGASGVCFVGDPNAVRDPLFEYGQKNDLSKIDRTPGPKTNNYPANSAIEDCLIHGIGRVERQPAGVQISMAQCITVRDTSIYDTARAGINISEGTWGGHLIERCDVFDTVLETHDHGSFNSWGRDRYWRSDHLTASQRAVDAEPNLPFLDAVKTTVIRDSRWRCDHGWDIDLDDGSSNYDIYNNLLLNSGLKLREGFRRHAWNNVAPFGVLHPHVWFQRSKDQVTRNIFAGPHGTARMSSPYVDGTTVDRNLYNSEDQRILKHAATLGWDANSMLGDAMFINPATGDFRVKDGSPALKLGFKNFPMDQFGVKKPSLKAIAKTPSFLPKSSIAAPAQIAPSVQVWLGAKLRDLKGEEFSAFGVSKEAGGVVLADVRRESAAAKAGLVAGDLIQSVEGRALSNTSQLFRTISGVEAQSLKLKIVRDQKTIVVTVQPDSTWVIETAANPDAFKRLSLRNANRRIVTANLRTNNEPLRTLTDGRLDQNYGPVFSNAVYHGAYKMDLGKTKTVSSITSWSYNLDRSRGAQKLTIYGSNSANDPGWDLSRFIPLATVNTGETKGPFTAVSLRAVDTSLGEYRWIVWRVSPVSARGGGENTAFQELAVETAGEDP